MEGQRRLGCARRIELREAVGWLEAHRREPQVPGTPRCASIGGGGDCGGRAPVRVRRGCARVSGRAPDWEERREQTAPEPPLRSIGGGGAGCDRRHADRRRAVFASAKREVGATARWVWCFLRGAIFLKEKFQFLASVEASRKSSNVFAPKKLRRAAFRGMRTHEYA